MEWKALSMVKVDFNTNKVTQGIEQAIETLLRKETNVDNLAFGINQATFYIWGETRIDYRVLDELKTMLQSSRYDDFDISAVEYKEVGTAYHYTSAQDTKSKGRR